MRTRAARLTALALTGGAAITLLGPAAAYAGDAEATGNTSDTDHGQNLTVTPESDPTFTNIGGGVGNNGVGASNTGVVAGEAIEVTTGDASSHGNESTSKLTQSAVSSGTGGGTTVLSQHAFILNGGLALADTGFSSGEGIATGNAQAWGNRSTTEVGQWSTVEDSGGGLRLVHQDSAVANLGLAVAETGFNLGALIETGNATAGGNESTTQQGQTADVTESPSGPVIVDQDELTGNVGGGIANTGVNAAFGDESTNDPEAE